MFLLYNQSLITFNYSFLNLYFFLYLNLLTEFNYQDGFFILDLKQILRLRNKIFYFLS